MAKVEAVRVIVVGAGLRRVDSSADELMLVEHFR